MRHTYPQKNIFSFKIFVFLLPYTVDFFKLFNYPASFVDATETSNSPEFEDCFGHPEISFNYEICGSNQKTLWDIFKTFIFRSTLHITAGRKKSLHSKSEETLEII